MNVDRRPGRPLFVAVKEAVREAIEQGRFAPGERLPSTKALAVQLDVSLVTVHRAMLELVASGVLRRGQGKGTFVHEDYAKRQTPAHGLRAGLVFHRESSLADPYHSQVLEGVRQQAEESGVDLVLLRFGEDPRNECQGYIYVNPFPDQLDRPLRFGRGVSRGRNEGLPIVVVGARSDRTGVASVDTDNVDIGASAARHLSAQGHTRVGFVGGVGTVSNDADRWAGFRATADRLGMKVDESHVIRHAGWRLDAASVGRLVVMLTAPRAERPTAVFAAGYYFALDTYEAAGAAGLRIPEDLSVIGVDDPPSAVHLSPPLTTFRQPLLKVGRLAVTELCDVVLRGEGLPQRTSLSAELVVRRSVREPSVVEPTGC
ncbi:MAG: GntR family transcriptional regulator [Phycisphaeraceae bacterium]|nr:MAG: GntR family transcriptional regulator [Phycisphaeraceae bacterium]